MKQGLLPLIPAGASALDELLSVFHDGTTVTWFLGPAPIRVPPVTDHATQRVMMAFLHVYHGVPQARLAAALGVHEHTVLAAVQRYRTGGDAAFDRPTGTRGPAVLTPAVVARCRDWWAAGWSRRAVAAAVGIKPCNIDKAIQKGLLPPGRAPARPPAGAAAPVGSSPSVPTPSTRATRAATDAASELGLACTRVTERVGAAVGLLAALAAPAMSHPEEARALVKALFHTTADLYPDAARQELRVVHPLAEPRLNRTLDLILPALNDAAFTYPGTALRLVYTRLPPATG